MAHRARNAVALVAALSAALFPLASGFGDAAPIQISSESPHAFFVVAAAGPGSQAFVRMEDSGRPFLGRAGPSREGPAGLPALVGSFLLVAGAAALSGRRDRGRAHAPLAVAPSRSPPRTAVA